MPHPHRSLPCYPVIRHAVQMQIDYLDKLIEISSAQLGVDIRKKGELPPLNGSEETEGNTAGK